MYVHICISREIHSFDVALDTHVRILLYQYMVCVRSQKQQKLSSVLSHWSKSKHNKCFFFFKKPNSYENTKKNKDCLFIKSNLHALALTTLSVDLIYHLPDWFCGTYATILNWNLNIVLNVLTFTNPQVIPPPLAIVRLTKNEKNFI